MFIVTFFNVVTLMRYLSFINTYSPDLTETLPLKVLFPSIYRLREGL